MDYNEKAAGSRLVEVKILGQTFMVKSDSDEAHIHNVARYVNDKMEEILKNTKTVSSLNVAILAALNIADDLLKEREKTNSILQDIGKRSRDLIQKIDSKMRKEA